MTQTQASQAATYLLGNNTSPDVAEVRWSDLTWMGFIQWVFSKKKKKKKFPREEILFQECSIRGGAAVKTLAKMLSLHIREPGFNSQLRFLLMQILRGCDNGSSNCALIIYIRNLDCIPDSWLWPWRQPSCCEHLESEQGRWKLSWFLSIYICVCLTTSQTNKQTKKRCKSVQPTPSCFLSGSDVLEQRRAGKILVVKFQL